MKHFKPRKRRPFPKFEEEVVVSAFDAGEDSDSDIEELTGATGRMTTNEQGSQAEDDDGSGTQTGQDVDPGLDTLPVWKLRLEGAGEEDVNAGTVKACVVGENGRLLVGVGEKEGVWIFRIPS